jgi:hypothetical protein
VKTPAAAVIFLLASGSDLSAHRLDEYLQATRVSIADDRIAIEMDLTPGVSIASSVIGLIDTNADGAIAPMEAEAYGRAVLSDLLMTVDNNRDDMTLVRVEVPTVDELRNGMGTIRLQGAGSVEPGSGRHRLQFFNNHRPEASVYMVNTLVPEDRAVSLGPQSRDPRQQEFQLEFTVTRRWTAQILWLGFGVAGLAGVWVARSKEKRKRKNE